jgi:hypothetical protein
MNKANIYPDNEDRQKGVAALVAADATQRATTLFDQLTGASYYGYAFREVLRTNHEAREAAGRLVACLKAAGVKGLE